MIATLSAFRRFGVYLQITLDAPRLARAAQPGQFVEIKIQGTQAPFWRRPFSICRAGAGQVELLIKTVGNGTRLLAQKKVGDTVDVIGPLGRGFTLKGKHPMLLIGGGFGVAPLLLAETLRKQGRAVEVLIGGRCEEDVLLRKELKIVGAKVACTTEDGSLGTQGRVTLLAKQRLETRAKNLQIAAAGPFPMLKAVAHLAQEYQVPTEVSLEQIMACGLGVCNGCVVKIEGQYHRVCKDGPVFDAKAVEWDAQ